MDHHNRDPIEAAIAPRDANGRKEKEENQDSKRTARVLLTRERP